MTSFKLGIDVSHWQGVMRWPMAWAAGARFAILRAGSVDSAGYHYTDYQWANNVAAAPDHMPCGTYWFFRPGKPAIDQADFYSNLIGQYHQSRRLLLRPTADVEQTDGCGPDYVAQAVSTFVNRVHDNLGIWPMIYTRSSFWNPYVGDLPLWDILDSIIARYKALVHPWSDGLWKPRDWNLPVAVGQPACWFWQFSADGNYKGAEFGADSPHIDLDYFLGDPGWFDGYVDFVSPPPEPPVPVEEKNMLLGFYPIKEDVLIQNGVELTGVNMSGQQFSVPDLPVGTKALMVRLVSSSDKVGGQVYVASSNYGTARFKVGCRQKVASPTLGEPYEEANGIVVLDGSTFWVQHDAKSGKVKYWVIVQGYLIEQ